MSTLASRSGSTPSTPRGMQVKAKRVSDFTLYLALALGVLGAWLFSRQGYFRSGDRVGYWLGVSGGVMMLVLLLYPARKYLRFTARWGKVKWWFEVHVILGIIGPLLILLHTTFHIGSANAEVALATMLLVAGSGIVGRFLYLGIYAGLLGEKSNLVDLQKRAGLAQGEVKSRFRFAPEVAEHLMKFENEALAGVPGLGTAFQRVLWLPIRRRIVYQSCAAELDRRLGLLGKERQWSRSQLHRRRARMRRTAAKYLLSVTRVAQLSAYERLFALWHLLHVPCVYLLALTAAFHVFAVHAY